MRIISGSARGRKLEAPEGMGTRPTADRFREMLFDTLQFRVRDACFLDLFSGSGAAALEALSRGAASAVLVERDPKALACIQKNIDNTGFRGQCRVLAEDVQTAVSRLGREQAAFDLIFMDPPYERGWEEQTAAWIREAGILKENGLLIVESSSRTGINLPGWTVVKEKIQRVTKFTFLQLEQ